MGYICPRPGPAGAADARAYLPVSLFVRPGGRSCDHPLYTARRTSSWRSGKAHVDRIHIQIFFRRALLVMCRASRMQSEATANKTVPILRWKRPKFEEIANMVRLQLKAVHAVFFFLTPPNVFS